jgi:succinoglycan biosynthesis transport protein ExoP
MADELVPLQSNSPYDAQNQVQAWQEPRSAASAAATRSPLDRPVAAIRRYKWLLLAVVLLATVGGVAAMKLVVPEYAVQAGIIITTDERGSGKGGPISSGALFDAADWQQLLKTAAVADPVIRKLALYLTPKNAGDADVFTGFSVSDSGWRPGNYKLDIDRTAKRWVLALGGSGIPIDSGAAGDSIGRKQGFRWVLNRMQFSGGDDRSVEFTVSTARETAVRLANRLNTQRAVGSNFMRLTLTDPNGALAAQILNTWAREFVAKAAELKKAKLVEFAHTLDNQLQTAKTALDQAESDLQKFRVNTIIEPGENAPVASGLQATTPAVFTEYFAKSTQYDQVKRDVALLRSLIARDSIPNEALLLIKSVPVSDALRGAVTEYNTAQANLVSARIIYTDSFPTVKELRSKIATLKTQRIPQFVNELLATLKTREVEDSVSLANMQVNLKQIPPRTIEEERLRRNRDVAALLYTDLQSRHANAILAERSSTPDVAVLDTAIAPLQPTANKAMRLLLMAIVGGIGGAIGLAILLDRVDGRLRYPEQATDELGLNVAGTVPQFPKNGIDYNSTEQTFQLVESFRSLRMTVLQASRERTVAIAVSSPSPSEGKSLISANLAMSFAEAGLRTVLVDGDTRRGSLHEMFALKSSPGLTDYLSGTATLAEVVMPTTQPSLCVIASGVRRRRSPELLTSPRLGELVDALRARHDVVIFDTPPLAAGIDGYSIATATGSLLVVLRVGRTARRMAAEKLKVFDRLPVDIVGAVLNGVQLNGSYEYYGYVAGYSAEEEAGTDVAKVT